MGNSKTSREFDQGTVVSPIELSSKKRSKPIKKHEKNTYHKEVVFIV